MLQLNTLEKLTKTRKRVGRGGDRGGHCGRGKDGQKARTGSNSEIKASFEGGQMPLSRRIPRRGFNNIFKKEFQLVKLSDLELKFAAGDTVNKETLRSNGLLKGKKDSLVKILGDGTLTKKLVVHADAISKSAIDAIEKVGGKTQLTKETRDGDTTP
jgi:large subunit ribosomal protein L15